MKKIILLTIFPLVLFAQSNYVYKFTKDILAPESITDSSDILKFTQKIDDIVSQCKILAMQENKIYYKHKKLFKLFQDKILIKYVDNPPFSKILSCGEFNCLTACTLYDLICKELKLSINLYVTPAHVYLSFNNEKGEEFYLELTNPKDGFDYDFKKEELVDELLSYKLVTPDEVKKLGVNEVFNKFQEDTKRVSDTLLIKYSYHNHIVRAAEKEDYDKAFNIAYDLYKIDKTDTASVSKLAATLAYNSLSYAKNTKQNRFRKIIYKASTIDSVSELYNRVLEEAIEVYFKYSNKKDEFLDTLLITNKNTGIKDCILNCFYYLIDNADDNSDYQSMQNICNKAFRNNFTSIKIQNSYVYATIKKTYNIVTTNYDTALVTNELCNLLMKLPKNKKAQEFLTTYIRESILNTNSRYCDTLVAYCENVYKKDSTNSIYKNLVAYRYHKKAMQNIKKDNLSLAIENVNKGLEYDSKNSLLIGDKKDIEELLTLRKKYKTENVPRGDVMFKIKKTKKGN